MIFFFFIKWSSNKRKESDNSIQEKWARPHFKESNSSIIDYVLDILTMSLSILSLANKLVWGSYIYIIIRVAKYTIYTY